MKYEDTICSKVSWCQQELQQALKTKRINMEKFAKMLLEIQSDAIHMENALKVNKQLREKHNIDPEYRKLLGEKEKPTGVNNFEKVDEKTPDKPQFELTLKDQQGDIVYHNTLYGFIMCAVEKLEDIDKDGVIDGTVQTLAVGNDLAILYAFDQLRQKFAGKFMEVANKLQIMADTGLLKDKFFVKKLLEKTR